MRILSSAEALGVAGGLGQLEDVTAWGQRFAPWPSQLDIYQEQLRRSLGMGAGIDYRLILLKDLGFTEDPDDNDSDEGLQAEERVQLWSEKFKTWSESDRKAIGNSMVATGALYTINPFAMSAGQFLTLLGAAIAEGDVNSAAFYCDQLERTTLNQTSKDVVLGGLEAVLDVAKIFKDRF